jgi:hypothetical protein
MTAPKISNPKISKSTLALIISLVSSLLVNVLGGTGTIQPVLDEPAECVCPPATTTLPAAPASGSDLPAVGTPRL